jgi:hypothetical protein
MAEPMDDSERDTDDEQRDVPPEDDPFARSSLRLVDWPELRLVDPGTPLPGGRSAVARPASARGAGRARPPVVTGVADRPAAMLRG